VSRRTNRHNAAAERQQYGDIAAHTDMRARMCVCSRNKDATYNNTYSNEMERCNAIRFSRSYNCNAFCTSNDDRCSPRARRAYCFAAAIARDCFIFTRVLAIAVNLKHKQTNKTYDIVLSLSHTHTHTHTHHFFFNWTFVLSSESEFFQCAHTLKQCFSSSYEQGGLVRTKNFEKIPLHQISRPIFVKSRRAKIAKSRICSTNDHFF